MLSNCSPLTFTRPLQVAVQPMMTFESQRIRVMADRRQWGDRIPDRGPYTESSQYPSSLPLASIDHPPPANGKTRMKMTMLTWKYHVHRPTHSSTHCRQQQEIESATLSSSQSNGVVTMASTMNWTLQRILDQAPNFHEVDRIAATSATSSLTEAITHHEREDFLWSLKAYTSIQIGHSTYSH